MNTIMRRVATVVVLGIMITTLTLPLPIPSPLWGEGKGEGAFLSQFPLPSGERVRVRGLFALSLAHAAENVLTDDVKGRSGADVRLDEGYYGSWNTGTLRVLEE